MNHEIVRVRNDLEQIGHGVRFMNEQIVCLDEVGRDVGLVIQSLEESLSNSVQRSWRLPKSTG